MARVTEHFSREEFACHNGDAYPEKWVASRLTPLCEMIEIIRKAAGGKAVNIRSGYRSPVYNRSIGGARASRHMSGEAADIVVAGMSAPAAHALVLRLYDEGKLERLGGLGSYPNFTHVDVRKGDRLARWSGSRIET